MIQARYGWSDREVLNLPFLRFLEITETIQKQISKENLEQWQRQAFTVWLALGEKGQNFSQFLTTLGLTEEKALNKEAGQAIDKQQAVNEAKEKSNEVLSQFKGG